MNKNRHRYYNIQYKIKGYIIPTKRYLGKAPVRSDVFQKQPPNYTSSTEAMHYALNTREGISHEGGNKGLKEAYPITALAQSLNIHDKKRKVHLETINHFTITHFTYTGPKLLCLSILPSSDDLNPP